jgi:hypothetical protein
MQYGSAVLGSLAIQIPHLVALIVGIVLALVTWKRNPTPSLLAVISFGLSLILLILYVGLANLPIAMNRYGYSLARVGVVMGIIGIILSFFQAAAWGLIIAAIFSNRRKVVPQSNR